MAINPLGAMGPGGIAGAGTPGKAGESFGQVMKGQGTKALEQTPALNQAPQQSPSLVQGQPPNVQQVSGAKEAQAGVSKVEGASKSGRLEPTSHHKPAGMLDQVNQAQQRMEDILKMAESGKSFSPAELLALQTHVYRASQELDMAGKVVEKATGGVKQVLQTQV
jgi:flagellar hook-basal body complex protein FliE